MSSSFSFLVFISNGGVQRVELTADNKNKLVINFVYIELSKQEKLVLWELRAHNPFTHLNVPENF